MKQRLIYKVAKFTCFALLIALAYPNYGYAMRDSLAAQQKVGAFSGQGQKNKLPMQSDAVSFAELLTGSPGIQVTETGAIGAAPQLMMRGLHSINLRATPQVFVDGVPIRYSGHLNPFLSTYEPTRFGFVNINDIGHVYVENEAKSLSEIGGRGANGAIYLVTDRGAFGGTQIDFTANYGISNADYNVPRMGAGSFKYYLWDMMKENGYSDQELQQNPLFDVSLPQYNHQTDWVDMITRTARFSDYHIKLKGGDGDANYMFSLGYTGKDETLVNADWDRISMRFNLDYQVSSRWEITNNLAYSNLNSNYFEQGANRDIHPLFVSATKAPFFHDIAYNDEGQMTRLLAGVDPLGKSNPRALVHNMRNDNEENRVDGQISAKWLAADNLTLNSVMAVNYFNMKENQHRPALGIVNDRHRIRQNSKRNSSEFMLLWHTYLDKSGVSGDWLSYNAKAGAWVETYEEKSIYARKVNAGTDDYETLEQGTVDSASNVKFMSNLMMLYLRGEVDMWERVRLSANLNLEGTSNFGPKGRWNVYPGVRFTADLLERSHLHQIALRGSWGRSGNHDVRGYYQHNLYYPINYFGFGGVYLGNVANEFIKPEITDTYELGMSFGLLGQRLRIDAGYYYKLTQDLITYKAVPIEVGLGAQYENSGVISSGGVELGLDAKILDGSRGVSWSVYGNVSSLRNQVEELYNGDIIKTLAGVSGIAREDERLGSFYGYRVLGVFASQDEVNLNKADGTPYQAGDYRIADINGDGRINESDKQVIGSALPDFFGGFGTNLGYKRFALDARFTYSIGNDIYNSFRQQMHVMSDFSNQSPDVSGRWVSESSPGTGWSRAALGDPSFNGAASDLWVEDGSYIRLKNISLSYDIPLREGSRLFRGVKAFLTGENLLTFTNYSGLDPEVVSVSDPLLRGIDFGASPLPRTFMLGLRVSF